MQLSVAPQVLLWDAASSVLRRPLEKEYEALLYESLKGTVDEPEVSRTSGEAIRLAMTAPRSARLLLWPQTVPPARSRRFLIEALTAERTLCGDEAPGSFRGWTADGRARLAAGGEVAWQARLAGTDIPVDVRSPQARSLDLLGGSRAIRPPRAVPSPEVAGEMVRRVEDAWTRIRATPGSVADCVAAWTRAVIVQADPTGRFWSGSNGQYVGRVMLVNPHAAGTVEEVADALVHEAIHGFLSMHERVEPWVNDPGLYTDETALTSPWSGHPLPLRPFLQACFVWYGLAMFWGIHVGGAVFDGAAARELLVRSLRGFCGQSLADMLWPWRERVRPELVELVTDMQRTVRSLVE